MAAPLNSTLPENIPGDGDRRRRRRRRHVGPKLRTEFVSLFGDDEFDVADVLLNLPHLINNPVSGPRVVPSGWGTKRKRSGEKSQSTSSTLTVVSPTPPPQCPPPLVVVDAVGKAEVSSPDTPFDFFSTDAERQSKEHSVKKMKTAMTKKLIQSSSVNDSVHDGPSTSTVLQQHPPSIPDPVMNQTVQLQLQLGPPRIDLNMPPAEEDMAAVESAAPLQPLDHDQTVMNLAMRRAYVDRTRAARQNRMQLNKLKKMRRGM